MIKRKLFIVPLFFSMLASAKSNTDLFPVNTISALRPMLFFRPSTMMGNVTLHTIPTSNGILYINMNYMVNGDVTIVTVNGLPMHDANDLTISGFTSSFLSGAGDSAWTYEVSAYVQNLTISKTYTVGISFNASVSGTLEIKKRRKDVWPPADVEYSTASFSKTFQGILPPPPKNPIEE